jgi:hypothetical protein
MMELFDRSTMTTPSKQVEWIDWINQIAAMISERQFGTVARAIFLPAILEVHSEFLAERRSKFGSNQACLPPSQLVGEKVFHSSILD